MELIAEKQKRDFNNNLSSDEPSDFVAVLQLEDPQGIETFVNTRLSILQTNASGLNRAMPCRCKTFFLFLSRSKPSGCAKKGLYNIQIASCYSCINN